MRILKAAALFLCLFLALPCASWSKEAAMHEKKAHLTEIEKIVKNGAGKSIGILGANNALLADFYSKRSYNPAWQMQEDSARHVVKDFISFIRSTLEEHGLGDRGYPFHQLEENVTVADTAALAKADVLASEIVLRLAKSLSGQDPVPVSKLHTWPLKRGKIDIAGGLNKAIAEGHVPEFLESLAPQVKAYTRLKDALKQYREIAEKGGWRRIYPGGVVQEGAQDDRIGQIQQRLAQEDYMEFPKEAGKDSTYTTDIADAMRAFQEAHGLYPDGNIGPETFRALNVPVKERIAQIRVNLARIRQSPDDAWENIVINIPSARLSYYRHGEVVYEAPVVVGRVDRQSPLVKSAIYEMIINPSWYVPSSIAEKDLLPKMEEDPEFMEKQGIHKNNASGDGMFRQDPGPLNSLGRIKFNFANSFAVYLHGTPHQELFGKDDRTRSSGCIRLKDPAELAMIIMKNSPEWTPEKIQQKIDSMKTMHITPPEKTPIKILYWTTIVDSKDRVEFFNDVYELDEEWLKLL